MSLPCSRSRDTAAMMQAGAATSIVEIPPHAECANCGTVCLLILYGIAFATGMLFLAGTSFSEI